MKAQAIHTLAEQLSERDHQILRSLEDFRLLDTRQIQRLHFADHETELAAARAAARSMQRLQSIGVVAALDRRIGGVRRGSASYIWQLAATGDRYLRAISGEGHRRRFVEPSATFTTHTLAVNDMAVALLEAGGSVEGFSVEQLVTEPKNWRSFLGRGGETRWLKPDLTVVTVIADGEGEYEEHAFVEMDLGTEHLPRIQTKCRIYADYAVTGIYQTEHDLFPTVVWISDDEARRRALATAIAGMPNPKAIPSDLFRVTSSSEFLASLRPT